MRRTYFLIDLEQTYSNAPVAQVAHLRRYSRDVSGCSTAPYEFFPIVRNDEVGGSNPLPSTKFLNISRTRCA
jgi:hypothetical protein